MLWQPMINVFIVYVRGSWLDMGLITEKKTIETRMAIVPQSSVSFYSNEIIEYLRLEKEQRQIEEQNDAKENEQSVNLNDEEL